MSVPLLHRPLSVRGSARCRDGATARVKHSIAIVVGRSTPAGTLCKFRVEGLFIYTIGMSPSLQYRDGILIVLVRFQQRKLDKFIGRNTSLVLATSTTNRF